MTAAAFTITGSMSSSITNIINTSNIELWDADTNTKIQADAQVYDNQIVFYDIMQDFPNDTTKNFKVLFTQIGDVSPYFGETFGLIPFDINVSNPEYNGGIVLNNEFTTLYNTLDLIEPTTLVTLNTPLSQNSKIATLKVTNVDSTSDLTLSGVLLQVQIHSSTLPPVSFTGVVCLRDLGSTASCGTLGTTQATEITQSGGIFYFDIQGSLLSNTGTALSKNGGYAEYEVYIENTPLWIE